METTEQNKSEEKFRKVLELAPDGIVVIDHDRKMQIVNAQTEKMFGYTREEMIGNEVELLMPNRFRHEHPAQERKFIAEQKPRPMGVGKELFGKRKDGSEFPIEISLVPLQSGDEKEDMTVLAVIRDITKQKRITKELTEAKAKAEIALQSKQQFLAIMSHEIRTPMTAIIGFTQVLLQTDLSENQKEYLQIIKRSGDGLVVLINDILDLAKVDAGKMTFEQTPFKMEFSILTLLKLFELKIQEKNLEIVKEYDNKIPEVLVGDAIHLHQILLNLLSNALKFTAKGIIIVAVRLINEDKEKATIEFSITDTGIGIAEDNLENIFENFQQATSSISRIYGGTGLGLAICKQLVEKQGGTISVKSKINEGSTFSFTLSFQKTNTEIKSNDGGLD